MTRIARIELPRHGFPIRQIEYAQREPDAMKLVTRIQVDGAPLTCRAAGADEMSDCPDPSAGDR